MGVTWVWVTPVLYYCVTVTQSQIPHPPPLSENTMTMDHKDDKGITRKFRQQGGKAEKGLIRDVVNISWVIGKILVFIFFSIFYYIVLTIENVTRPLA